MIRKAGFQVELRSEAARLFALLASAERSVARRFLELVDGAAAVQSLEAVADLLEAGRFEQAFALADEIGPALATAAEQAYVGAGLSAARVLRERAPTLLDFNTLNPRAAEFLRLNRQRVVSGFAQQQRGALLDSLLDAQRRGLAPLEQARRLRASLGLNEHLGRAVLTYRDLLERNSLQALRRQLRDRRFDASVRRAARENLPLPPELIERMVGRYRERLVDFRARTVARSLALTAVNGGDEELWQQAVDAGAVDPDRVVNVWRTKGDDEVRDSHRSMNGQRRGLKERFRSGAGVLLRYPGDPEAPPSETANCRCVVARTLLKS